jgi:hypothetical protein
MVHGLLQLFESREEFADFLFSFLKNLVNMILMKQANEVFNC